ncbi:MAG: glutamate racemase [Chloroflexi bacterium GWB2_49_20]|nr:MAG: glutamate racemase [Chloroflexi bacterium GWB2_49_20]OGN78171.1 MAG: glutamate racemase [Chloroflexi bacterium GWC2_49_37]OGN85207.1 MAG: glutamate racemase [Chloroflexi bacterium GWD2_49_16]
MKKELIPSSPIGIFDSGVGGLSVLKAIRNQLPNESILYLADQSHVPYGQRSLEDVRQFSTVITQFLLDQGTKLIVVACNTASAAALHHLRITFPHISFVGMEPAVKPAAEFSLTRRVGVLATPATFQGALYASVVERFARDVTIYQHTCPGLVEQIEAGDLDTSKTRAILEDALLPMVEKGIDTIVLGCTHYPFVIPLIKNIVGDGIRVIDPAPAVARQIDHVLNSGKLSNIDKSASTMMFYTTGNSVEFNKILPRLLLEEGDISSLTWMKNGLSLKTR